MTFEWKLTGHAVLCMDTKFIEIAHINQFEWGMLHGHSTVKMKFDFKTLSFWLFRDNLTKGLYLYPTVSGIDLISLLSILLNKITT